MSDRNFYLKKCESSFKNMNLYIKIISSPLLFQNFNNNLRNKKNFLDDMHFLQGPSTSVSNLLALRVDECISIVVVEIP